MISGDIIKAPPAVPIDLCVIGRQINVLAILCKWCHFNNELRRPNLCLVWLCLLLFFLYYIISLSLAEFLNDMRIKYLIHPGQCTCNSREWYLELDGSFSAINLDGGGDLLWHILLVRMSDIAFLFKYLTNEFQGRFIFFFQSALTFWR